jgi:hypothetical protein
MSGTSILSSSIVSYIRPQDSLTSLTLGSDTNSTFEIGLDNFAHRPELMDNFTWWAFGEKPLWLNFSNPTILNLKNTTWDPDYAVDLVVPDEKKDKWVYIAITAPPAPMVSKPNRGFAPVAHPVSKF